MEYTILFWLTLIAHFLLLWASICYPNQQSQQQSSNSNDYIPIQSNNSNDDVDVDNDETYKPLPGGWVLLHVCLGLTGVWLGGFAHNGLHMWSRRKFESLVMYILASNNPFRWMSKHIVGHHMYTNTSFDSDKPVVVDCQKWILSSPYMIPLALGLGTFLVGFINTVGKRDTSIVSMTTFEQRLPLLFFGLIMIAGISFQGYKKWIPRYLLTLSIMCFYSFVLFQVSHYQPQTLDGDNIHATVDDWAEFQLKTTWGWNQLDRPLLNIIWLNLNLQPGHRIFPAIHHSKLRLITPIIRQSRINGRSFLAIHDN